MTSSQNQPVGVLVSGGLDSCILVGRMLELREIVQPIFIDSRLVWQGEELNATQKFLAAVTTPRLLELKILSVPLDDVYGDHWSLTGRATPDRDSPDAAVYLPGRNPLLLVKAAVWCRLQGIERIALAPLVGNPFADATVEFFAQFERIMSLALSGPLRIERPFGKLTKRQVLAFGRDLPLELTFSCIAPRDGKHCGECNKCFERQQAFQSAEIVDPTKYHALGME